MQRLALLEKNLAIFFLYIPFVVLAVIVKLVFWIRVFYRQRGSLSEVPGPKWAAFSRLWLVKVLASGRSSEIFVTINKRYGNVIPIIMSVILIPEGSLARIGPNSLMTSDPEVTRRILAARSGYLRGPWFDSLRIDPQTPNIVSERDERKHNRLKYKLSASVGT